MRAIQREDAGQIRPCLADRKARTQARWDFIARYSGKRSPAWIGLHLGMTADQVNRFMERNGIGPTASGDYLTSGYVAELLGCTQQWVVRLIKAGKLQGRRNPGPCRGNQTGRRWWLISRHAVHEYLREQGRRADQAILTEPSGWPGVILAGGRGRAKSAHSLRLGHTRAESLD